MTIKTSAATRGAVGVTMLSVMLATPALGQTMDQRPSPPVSRSGPRAGVTFLSDGNVEALEDRGIDVNSAVAQFGWQFEKRITTGARGLSAVNEWVVLVGGLEEGLVLPSLSWLVGLRTHQGIEFGVGPNLTPAGVALAFAAGVTFRTDALNVPVNVAVVPSRSGTRVSLLTGFNMRR